MSEAKGPPCETIPPGSAAEQATRSSTLSDHRGLVFSIAVAVFMAYLDGTIVNISLPTISRDLGVDCGTVSWVVLIYLLMQSSTLMLCGKIADRIGLRTMLLWGYGVFTFGSVLCGLSGTIVLLVLSRLLQGIGGSMLIVTAFALVPRFFPAHLTGVAFGIVTTSAALGTTVGAPLGGLITTVASWPWIFLINVPIGVLAIAIGRSAIPHDEPKPEEPGTSFDYAGVVLSFAAISCLLYAFNTGREWGWTSPVIVGFLSASAIFLTGFAVREATCRTPLVRLALFANPAFLFAILAAVCGYAFLAGNTFLIPFYLELVQKLPSGKSGLVMLCYSVPLMIVGPLAGRLSHQVGPRVLCCSGMGLAAVACFAFTATLALPTVVPALFTMIAFGLAFGLFNSPNNNHIMRVVPRDSQGTIFGTVQTIVRSTMAVGTCLFEALFSQWLPESAATGSGPSGLALTPESTVPAFAVTFAVGGALCVAATIASFIATGFSAAPAGAARQPADGPAEP